MAHSGSDRPRGMLTEKDRNYLWDGSLPESKQARYERRKGTRRRIRNSIFDFKYVPILDPEERRKLFDELREHASSSIEDYLAYEGMIWTIYWGLQSDPALSEPLEAMETIIRRGCEAASDNNDLFSVGISRFPDPDSVYEKFEAGHDLSSEEIAVLVRAGKLDEADLAQLKDPQVIGHITAMDENRPLVGRYGPTGSVEMVDENPDSELS